MRDTIAQMSYQLQVCTTVEFGRCDRIAESEERSDPPQAIDRRSMVGFRFDFSHEVAQVAEDHSAALVVRARAARPPPTLRVTEDFERRRADAVSSPEGLRQLTDLESMTCGSSHPFNTLAVLAVPARSNFER
jgi:hypothetical protein